MASQYFVYVIWNATHSRYYVGQTEDIDKRLRQHNDPENNMSKFTKKYDGGWVLLYSETLPSRSGAMKREKELKTGKGRDWIKSHILP